MSEEELHAVKLEVGLLKNEVEVRGRQVDALLQKLEKTTDSLIELTVQIKTLNSRQQDHLTHDNAVRDELKLLHTRIGSLHDKLIDDHSEIEKRLDSLDQYKSKLMGMIIVVGSVVGMVGAWLLGFIKD
jgi:chromosome segregation ATPase